MHPVMALLTAGIPLTLLLDLHRPDGPDSRFIYLSEQPHAARVSGEAS